MPLLKLSGTAFLLTVLLLTPGLAWNEEGHRTVALVAERRMSKETREWAESLLRHHPHGIKSLSDASCWPDQVRDQPEFHRGPWHYLNQPLWLDGEARLVDNPGQGLWALNAATRTVKDRQASARERAIALAWVIHLVGDLHQPMHAVTGFTETFPEGDRGGNRVVVRLGKTPTNLHGFWDSAGGLYWRGANRQRLGSIVAGITVEYPAGPAAEVRSPNVWASESYALARDLAYPGVVFGEPLSEDYIARSRACSMQRLALAGYRLGDYLERLRQTSGQVGNS